MKILTLSLILLTLISCSNIGILPKIESDVFDDEVRSISESLLNQIPPDSRVLILDFKDLNEIITHFGRYLAERISVNLSNDKSIQTVDRNNIEVIISEQKLQLSGIVDENSAVNIGKITGATHIVFGTIAEFQNYVGLDLKIVNVENGTVIGGVSPRIETTRNIATLVSTIVKSEEQQQKELEVQRQKIISDIESERFARLKAIEDEEKQKKRQLIDLENEIREKSIIISEYEARKKELQKQQTYIQQIHTEIDRINSDIITKLKIGMTKNQVTEILGDINTNCEDFSCACIVSGRYFLIFNGSILVKVVLNGSRNSVGYIIDSCTGAKMYGQNIIKY